MTAVARSATTGGSAKGGRSTSGGAGPSPIGAASVSPGTSPSPSVPKPAGSTAVAAGAAPAGLRARLADDEEALIAAVFGDEVSVNAEWHRRHGIASLKLFIVMTFPSADVVVVLRFTSTTSGALGTVLTEFGTPEFDADATTTLSMATTRDLAAAIADNSADGSTLEGGPISLDPALRDWRFSSGGWLVGAIAAAKEVLGQDGRLGGGGSTSSGVPLFQATPSSDHGSSGAGMGGVRPPTVADILQRASSSSSSSSSGTVILSARVYQLSHMRRPVEYTRTLQTWIGATPFDGRSGFLSSVIAVDIKSPKVVVAVLHLDNPSAAPHVAPLNPHHHHQQQHQSSESSTTTSSAVAVAAFADLERLWKSQPVDYDLKGKPCFERLSRVVVDVAAAVPLADVVAALEASPLQFAVGTVEHTVAGPAGSNGAKISAWCGPATDRAGLDGVLLQAIGLSVMSGNCSEPPTSARGTSGSAGSGGGGNSNPRFATRSSSSGPQQSQQHHSTYDAYGKSVFAAFETEIVSGNVWAS